MSQRDLPLNLDGELVTVLTSDPNYAQEPFPLPEGRIAPAFVREQSKAFGAPLGKYYGERLPAETEYTVVDKVIPVQYGLVDVRVVKPTAGGPEATYPVLVWFHGGGWVFGDIEQDDNHLRTISVDLQLAVVNVEYRHAPEYLFPAAFDDCYAGLKWTVENATALQISLSKGFIVGGDSAGGNLSAAVSLKARDDPFFSGNPLTGQYLREPALIHPSAQPDSKYASELKSYTEYMDAPLSLNGDRAAGFFRVYSAPPTDQRMSPLLASSHAGLPPAFIQIMEVDPLHDEGVIYERLLRDAGVQTKIVQHAGAMHAFYFLLPAIRLALEVDQYEREGLRWLLSFSQGSAGTTRLPN